MAGIKFDGFDELQRELQTLQRNANRLSGNHQISFDKLFTRSFMLRNTRYSSIDALLEAGGFHAKTNAEFNAIPQKELDAHIAKCTKFKNWEEMLNEATEQYITKELGF